MSISVKISQLDDGGSVASTDLIPVARGSINTFKIPANQFVINGSNVGIGTGQLFFDRSTGAGTTLQFRSLSGADGLAVSNQGNTLVISASGQNPVKTSITGTSPVPTNGINTTFAINGATSVNPNNYRVDIDGVLQEPINDYTIVGSNIVFNPAPPAGSKVTVVSNNLVRAYDIIPSDGSVTPQKLNLLTGNVGIGTNTPSNLLHITSIASTQPLRVETFGLANTVILAANAGGTPTTPTATLNGVRHCALVGSTYGTTGFGNPTAINFYNSQNHTDTARGSYINFENTANNTTTRVERMRIDQNGNVGIGTTAPVAPLHITGTTSSGEGLRISPVAGHGEGGQLTLMDSTGSGGWEIDNVGTGPAADLRFFRDKGINNVDALRIKPTGDITNKGLPFYGCRAWVNFDATRNAAGGTDSANTNRFIRASGNVTSVLQVAAGDYRITFTTAMPTTDYCVTGIGSFANAVGSIGINTAEAPTTTTVRVRHGHFAGSGATGYPSSPTYGNVAIFC